MTNWSPLYWNDPVEGDPQRVKELAEHYRETADAIKTAVRTLREINDSDTVWKGQAAREFRAKTRETADTIEKAWKRYDAVARALGSYHPKLTSVQDSADSVRTAWRKEEEPESPETLEDYRTKMQPLITRYDQDGNDARDMIQEVTDSDDLDDSWKDNFWGAVKDIATWCGNLSAIFGVIALICSVIPGLQPFAALFGALALLTGVISLAANTALYATGRATLGDVLWDLVGVLSFGAGRAFTVAGRGLMTASRGMAKPAFIKSVRAAGASPRQAKRMARAANITGGGRTAKQAARAYKNGSIGIVPRLSQIRTALRRPFSDITKIKVDVVPIVVRDLPEVTIAIRKARLAYGVGSAAGVAGNIADIRQLISPHLASSPVER